MKSYIIEGGRKLEGEVKVSGSKNAALPILAATILNKGTTILENVPKIKDTEVMLEILEYLGCKVHKKHDKIIINSENVEKNEIPEELMRKMRSSIVLAGSILGRNKKVKFSCPGGCDIGSRPIDLHLKGFKKLGINIAENYGYIVCEYDKINTSEIHLDFPSVGATENIMLASVFSEGKVTIKNAALEPEIVDLQNFLNKIGAKISGAGTSNIEIIGVKELKSSSYKIMPDRIEAGTMMCIAAATNSKILIKDVIPDHITPVIEKLKECKCNILVGKNDIFIEGPKRINCINIKTMPYPGFPTDMQSIFGAMLATARGTSIITENIFENRFKYISELNRMGAKITIEGKNAIIRGVKKLYSAEVISTDLRGGAALTLAGLVAEGTTKINNIEYILRGYENLDKKLNSLGANIQIREGES